MIKKMARCPSTYVRDYGSTMVTHSKAFVVQMWNVCSLFLTQTRLPRCFPTRSNVTVCRQKAITARSLKHTPNKPPKNDHIGGINELESQSQMSTKLVSFERPHHASRSAFSLRCTPHHCCRRCRDQSRNLRPQ